jgi:predicted nucleotidyltransferase
MPYSIANNKDWSPYIGAWQERRRQADITQQQRASAGRAAAQECARVLGERYGARRVWLFGSLLQRRFVHSESDIDLAVEGLPPNQYFPALAMLWNLLTDTDTQFTFTLDLVPLEDAQPSLVDLIRAEGKLLYEHA